MVSVADELAPNLDELIGVNDEDAALAAQLAAATILSDEDWLLVPEVVDILWAFASAFTGVKMYPYQEEFGRRILESVVTNDGATITALFGRQMGKSETVANMVCTLMIMLPLLAQIDKYANMLGKFKGGIMIGTFGPVKEQAAILFKRVTKRLTSARAKEILSDPEISDEVITKGKEYSLRRLGSFISVQSAHPTSNIEGTSFHLLIVDEAQRADETVVGRSIGPMGAAYNATMVMLGTPWVEKGVFFKRIRRNRREQTGRGRRQNHFEYNWRVGAKCNPNYAAYVQKEMDRLGPDSDEFRMAYGVEWILERGMFVTSSLMDELGDRKLSRVKSFHGTCIAGIDPARKIDSTVVTVVHVDWDRPNENGLCPHLILDWLEMPGEDWETQFFRMREFLLNYNLVSVGIDGGGMGDVIADRMRHLLPEAIQVEAISSSPSAQSVRWQYLTQLLTGTHPDTGRLLQYPADYSARRTKTWQRFYLQMTDAVKHYVGNNLMVSAPDDNGSHDDFCDSLALACIAGQQLAVPEVQVSSQMFFSRGR